MDKQRTIFKQFLYEHSLRFSDIEKRTGIRSNELAYYVKRLVDAGVLHKQSDAYALTQQAEQFIPFFQEHNIPSPLPVVLVGCFDEQGRVLLVRREKRPYKGLWSLPGGRILLGETVEQAAQRIMKTKTFLDVEVSGVQTVGNERVLGAAGAKHGFILLYVRATPHSQVKEKETVRWFSLEDIDPAAMIASDYALLTAKKSFYEFSCVDE